jgi:hypothetical protein
MSAEWDGDDWQQRSDDGEDENVLALKQREAHVTPADVGEAYETTRVSFVVRTLSQIKREVAMLSIDIALRRRFAQQKAKAALQAKKAKKRARSNLRNRSRNTNGQFI